MQRPIELLALLLILVSAPCAGADTDTQSAPAASPAVPSAMASSAVPADARSLRQQALDRWEAGEREQAIGLMDQVLARFPEDADNYYTRGKMLGELTRYDAAIADLRRVTELAPDDAGAWGNLGWYLILQGDFLAAQAASAKAQERAPDSYEWTINLGHAYLLQGERAMAHAWYEKTVSLIPDETALTAGPLADFDRFIERGWQTEASQEERAWLEQAARQAIPETRPVAEQQRLADAAWQEGQGLAQANRNLEAAAAFRRAAELEQASGRPRMPNLPAALVWAGTLYQAAGRFDEAEPLLREALAIAQQARPAGHPDIATSLDNLAQLLYTTGRYDEAEPLYRKALAIRQQARPAGLLGLTLIRNSPPLLVDTVPPVERWCR